jgi:hypothetical protein
MRTRALARTVMTLASVMTMWAAGEANAGLFRTYLSLNGSDANACTLSAPCRLLPAALAAVNDGGEIWMLDSANFNTATVGITKSVTILAVPGALGSVVANGGDAISINTAAAMVTLRNVVILNLSGLNNNGISFSQGAELTVEGSELYGLNNAMSLTAAGSVVTIKDTTIRDNTTTGVTVTGAVKVQLRNAAVLNNGGGVIAANGAAVAIAGSAISGNTTGVQSSASGSTTTQVALSGSTISGNTTGLQVTAATGADTAQAMINKMTLSQNGTAVNMTGGTATVFSLTNNAFKFNTADIGTGTLTALAAQ